MRYVVATKMTYDAAVGRILRGQRYWVEDDKAERWVNAGVATLAPETTSSPPPAPAPAPPAPAPPQPAPAAAEAEEPDDEGRDPEQLRAEVKRLSNEEGLSQRDIANQLGISRDRVRALLAS